MSPNFTEILLVIFVVIFASYFIYKISWNRDYGLVVRRSFAAKKMIINKDAIAEVPFWWTDVQIQKAMNKYWRQRRRQEAEKFDEPAQAAKD